MITIDTPTKDQLREVIWWCRDWNQRELHNSMGIAWRPQCVEVIWTSDHRFMWRACWDGEPVAVFGMTQFAPGNWSVYMVATDAVEKCARPLARKLRRTFLDFLEKEKPVSVVACALTGNPKSPRWFATLGATFARTEGKIDVYQFKVS